MSGPSWQPLPTVSTAERRSGLFPPRALWQDALVSYGLSRPSWNERSPAAPVTPHSNDLPPGASFTDADAIRIAGLRHAYGHRVALEGVAFTVARGELFAVLGPNGSGKTTLFKILSTLVAPQAGAAWVFGNSLADDPGAVRRRLGVVFQRPSVDGKLTVRENLLTHGHLYGLRGAGLRDRTTALLRRFDLAERAADRLETLSGGMQRRVELAKALLPRPPVLLLDEPTTGIDPRARRDFMHQLRQLCTDEAVTVVLTTHHMEEAERCDRVALLHRGHLVAIGAPRELMEHVGGDVVVIRGPDLAGLREKIRARFACEPAEVDGALRLERHRGHEFLRDLVEAFPDDVSLVTYGKPTLDDVFVHLTGDRFWAGGSPGT